MEDMYKEKLIALLEGLEVRNIKKLMDTTSVDGFKHFGEVFTRAIKDKINNC